MLYGKTVLIGVTGGIAAYKACDIVSRLIKQSASVEVIMTAHATEFITPLTFETLTGNETVTDMFKRKKGWEIGHISLAKKADVMVVAPATANVIAKLAQGIADDMLTTTFIACKTPKIICPAMNTAMYKDAKLQENLAALRDRGVIIVEPQAGRLACGDEGTGKLADTEIIYNIIARTVQPKDDFSGKSVLVTAGATRVNIDGVRYLSNRSSGKMGIEIARAAIGRGAKVTLVAGFISCDLPKGLFKVIRSESTEEMYDAVINNTPDNDYIIKAAAPSDYTVKPYKSKIKSDTLNLELVKTVDIAKKVGEIKGGKKLIIFSAETDNLIEYSVAKMKSKNADIVVANDVTKEGAGFDTDTNIVTIITKSGSYPYEKMNKSEVAEILLDHIIKL